MHCHLVWLEFNTYSGEIRTSLDFEWLKRGWMPNGLVYACHLNTGQPNHLNNGQMDAILFSFILLLGIIPETGTPPITTGKDTGITGLA